MALSGWGSLCLWRAVQKSLVAIQHVTAFPPSLRILPHSLPFEIHCVFLLWEVGEINTQDCLCVCVKVHLNIHREMELKYAYFRAKNGIYA